MKAPGRTLIILLTAVCASFGPAASGEPGSVQDPQDTPTSKVDIRAVYHDDDPSTGAVTYFIEMWRNVDNANWVGDVVWDFDGDGERDGTVQFTLEYGDSAILYDAEGEEVNRDQAQVGRAAVSAPHSSSASTASNTLKVTVTRRGLQMAGMPSGAPRLRYYVAMRQQEPQIDDHTTDGKPTTTHTFGARATPTPVTPAAAPVPTSPPGPGRTDPTPVPAAETAATPTPVPETSPDQSPTPTEDVPAGFAAPDSTDSGGSSRLPLAAAAAFVLIGSGIGVAFLRRRAG